MKYTKGNLEVKQEFNGKLSDLACIDIPNQLARPDNINYYLGPSDEDEGQDEGSDELWIFRDLSINQCIIVPKIHPSVLYS